MDRGMEYVDGGLKKRFCARADYQSPLVIEILRRLRVPSVEDQGVNSPSLTYRLDVVMRDPWDCRSGNRLSREQRWRPPGCLGPETPDAALLRSVSPVSRRSDVRLYFL